MKVLAGHAPAEGVSEGFVPGLAQPLVCSSTTPVFTWSTLASVAPRPCPYIVATQNFRSLNFGISFMRTFCSSPMQCPDHHNEACEPHAVGPVESSVIS